MHDGAQLAGHVAEQCPVGLAEVASAPTQVADGHAVRHQADRVGDCGRGAVGGQGETVDVLDLDVGEVETLTELLDQGLE